MMGQCWLLVVIVVLSQSGQAWSSLQTERQKQRTLLTEAEWACRDLQKSQEPPTDGVYCNIIFDDVTCWPFTSNGTTARLLCPWYIQGFDPTAYATKKCMGNGSWYVSPVYNLTWTNYSMCPEKLDPYTIHIPKMIVLSNIGYSISLSSLVLAIFIMVYFKRLHCNRNTIHMNLFASLILRALTCFLRFNHVDVAATHLRSPDSTNWDCKLVATLFMYSQIASYVWVLVEGLYLHILIFVSVFSDKKSVCCYLILFGWLFPCAFMIPWIFIRIYVEDVNCWMTHPNPLYYWLLKAPIIGSIFISFLFFLNIVRVLYTKLMASNTNQTQRYRKLAKSTLVLIPLFGVYYVVFICIPPQGNIDGEIIRLYIEMMLNAFQGLFVALLFCFLNAEVRTELRGIFTCFQKKRSHEYLNQTQISYTHAQGNPRTTSSSDKEQSVHMASRVRDANDSELGSIELRKLTSDDTKND